MQSTPPRLAFGATHVVMADSYAAVKHAPHAPGPPSEIAEHIDWQATGALRRRLDRYGFGVAEAMDTAQRFEIGWQNAERLIHTCGALKLEHGFVAGAGVDHLPRVSSKRELIDGVAFQAGLIRQAGGIPILLPLLWLPEQKATEADYVEVYTAIVRQLEGPLFVHWLGEVFHSGLAGYFPGNSFERILAYDPSKVRGAKLSLLDAEFERRVRTTLLERDQIVLTGDDFHFAELIEGRDARPQRFTSIAERKVALGDFSHALLGILDAIARPAARALAHLAQSDSAGYRSCMTPCEALGQWLFQTPTPEYKAGLAFLSWIDGQQANAMLVNHRECSRATAHYLRAFELAQAADVFEDRTAATRALENWKVQNP